MGDHIIKHFTDTRGMYGCRCRCGWAPPVRYLTRQVLDDEILKHHRNVERVRAGLKPRSVSLAAERQWYLERAADPGQSPEDRALWQRMADELSTRINDAPEDDPDRGQALLW